MKASSKFGSDVLLDMIKALGIEYVTINPGSSIRGIHDSVVNYGGNKRPNLVLCCHEEIAVSIAAGYFRATNRPLVVLLHDLSGLFHAPRAIFDAWLQRDGLIIIGGNGPLKIESRRPLTDWDQIAESPNVIVRPFVKWDDQPYSLISAVESILRAYEITLTRPAGPVYISLDADIQEEQIDEEKLSVPSDVSRYAPTNIGEGSIELLTQAARLLSESERPAIVTGRYGRDEESIVDLVRLVETIGAGVIDTSLRFNFPTNHPQNGLGLKREILGDADVILALDVRNLFGELIDEESHYERAGFQYPVRPDTKIIRIDTEGVQVGGWMTDSGRLIPGMLTITAEGADAVRRLSKLCGDHSVRDSKIRHRVDGRISELTDASRGLRRRWMKQSKDALRAKKITYPSLSLLVWELVKDTDWAITYVPRGINPWLRRIWNFTRWFQYPGIAGGTGCGIGRAIGGALANKGRLCMDFQTDGDLLYSPSALWTVAHYRIPMLIIMVNNRSYYNDEKHQAEMAVKRQRPIENKRIGIGIDDPCVDFSKMASTYGLRGGGLVESVPALRESLVEGIDKVIKGHAPYVVDALVSMDA